MNAQLIIGKPVAYLNSAQFYKNQYVNKLNKHLQIEISHNLQPISYYLRIKETAKDLR